MPDKKDEYKVVSNEDKNYANVKRKVYRVAITSTTESENLMKIFKRLDLPQYDSVTVWFYSSVEAIQKGSVFNVAMIERDGKKAEPVLTMR